MRNFLIAVGLVPLFAGVSAPADETWPQWRGPTRDGQFRGAAWPDSIQAGDLAEIWRVKLGEGYSGPVVGPRRVYTVETEDRSREVVRAFDRQTGKALWTANWEGAMRVPFFARRNGSWVRSTPAFDGEALYVAGMRDVLVCLEAETGKQRWRVDFTQRYETPVPSFGFVCSPVVVGDHVYVQAGGAFVKLDKRTGKSIWRALADGGGMYGSAFSSPLPARLGGRDQVLVQTRQHLAGVDPANGEVLWKQAIKAFRGMNILTPTVHEERIFTSAHSGKAELFSVRPSAKGFSVALDWENRLQAYMSSPVVVGDHLYLHLRNKRFTCVNLKDGQVRWTTTRRFGEYWSMVARDDRILALDQDGTLLLIRADPERFELIDERELSKEETWAHLAVAGRQVFVRELRALAVYQWTAPAAGGRS
ncbi:MAG: PQQ-like beta-propeller repeat protein [Phycisphaerae bacterium]|nr:PQQ-like beta-propeller repeat protein [Phycisphaerae bacterium]